MTKKYTPEELAKLFADAQYDATACEVIATYFNDDGTIEELAVCGIMPRPTRAAVVEQMRGRSFPYLGQVKDDSISEVDIAAYNEEDDTLYVANVIPPDSEETLLHSALQVYRYYSSLEDFAGLCTRCSVNISSTVKPAVIFFENSDQQRQSEPAKVRKLIRTMGVELYVIRPNDEGGFDIAEG